MAVGTLATIPLRTQENEYWFVRVLALPGTARPISMPIAALSDEFITDWNHVMMGIRTGPQIILFLVSPKTLPSGPTGVRPGCNEKRMRRPHSRGG